MRNHQVTARLVVTVLSIGVLSACTSATSPTGDFQNSSANRSVGRLAMSGSSQQRHHGTDAAVSYSYSFPLLYVANWSPSTVQVYDARSNNPSPIATISDGIDFPTGDCIDAAGTLYVANEPAGGLGSISEYAAGKTKPFQMITEGINSPVFCTIDGEGNLWVTNIGAGNVTQYLKGSTKPHAVITNGLSSPNGLAIDNSGSLYVANGPSDTTINVQVYAHGSKSPTRTITDGVTSPVGITVDGKGTLYITNIDENNVEEYPAGKSHPDQAITENMNAPAGVTVNKKGRLYVSNYVNNVIVEFAPGSITPSKRTITKELYTPEGSAYYPPLIP